MRALVTGAAGFLGRHVVAALLARGHSVRAMVRPATRTTDLPWAPSVDVVKVDLRAPGDLEDVFDGVEVLVHLAAGLTGGEDLQFATTVVGTERLLQAMARTACRRLVLASSFAVYDWSAIHGTLDESSPLEPAPAVYERDGYTIAKWWQERVTRRLARQHGWDLTVLRPGFIWGPGHGYLASLGQRLGPIHVVIGPLGRTPLTYVENCADLFAVATTDARAIGQTLNVVDSDGEQIWSYLGQYLRRTGESAVRIPVPYSFAASAVRIAYATVFGRNPKLPHVLVPCRFESRLKPLRFGTRARGQLGWTPPYDYRTCLERTYGSAAPTEPRPVA